MSVDTASVPTREDALVAALSHGVSEKQFNFMLRLAGEREVPALGSTSDERVGSALRALVRDDLDRRSASVWIDALLRYPVAAADVPVALETDQPTELVKPGVFELDGEIYVVKPNRDKTRVYAKRLVELTGSAQRLTESGDVVDFEFTYAPGVVARLTEAHRMPLARAEELMTRYGKCVNCGRKLKAAASVARGIGPVCAKAFA